MMTCLSALMIAKSARELPQLGLNMADTDEMPQNVIVGRGALHMQIHCEALLTIVAREILLPKMILERNQYSSCLQNVCIILMVDEVLGLSSLWLCSIESSMPSNLQWSKLWIWSRAVYPDVRHHFWSPASYRAPTHSSVLN
jgi:hypothetical protein